MGVHVWGQPCEVESLTEIADKHQIKLMFDASHAFGCSHQGKMIGNFGNAEVFSFHATKFINAFEGGAIVTNDDQLNQKLRLMKNFGFSDFDKVIYLGTNGKMSEVSAAMGLTSLESMEEFIEVNYRNYKCYEKGLDNIPGISLFSVNESENHNYQYIVLEIDEEKTHVSRDLLIKILHAENVIARRYFYPGCHRMEPYRSYFPHAGLLLLETEKLAQRVLILPTGTAISEDDISKICQVIQIVVTNEIKNTNRDSENV
jgi:dTDP-4-amino-4,6-dideoxygalactose transaminase